MTFKERLAAIERMTPEKGFNLVGLDKFESDPADELYLVDNFPTREAAEAAKDERLKEDPEEVLYIYAAPGLE